MNPSDAYDLALVETKAIIDEADAEGLLASGAPLDEYSALAADVARRLLHDEDAATLVESWPDWRGVHDRQWCIERLQALQTRVRHRP